MNEETKRKLEEEGTNFSEWSSAETINDFKENEESEKNRIEQMEKITSGLKWKGGKK